MEACAVATYCCISLFSQKWGILTPTAPKMLVVLVVENEVYLVNGVCCFADISDTEMLT